MYICCSSLCFTQFGFKELVEKIRELGFNRVDLTISDTGDHLRIAAIMEDSQKFIQQLRVTEFSFSIFHLVIPTVDTLQNRQILKKVSSVARCLAVPLISISTAPIGSNFNTELHRLKCWNQLVNQEGVELAILNDNQSITADPLGAIELCQRIPGLGINLDPAEYHKNSHPISSVDMLFPHVKHIRLRDTTATGQQVKIGQGKTDFARLLSQLGNSRYSRALSIDIHDSPTIDYPIAPEVRKLKFLLASML